MTRGTFEVKRHKALLDYVAKAEEDIANEIGRNKLLNACHRKRMALDRLEDIEERDNFWTEGTERAYEMIYENAPEDYPVSAF